jgi:regulator of protease activity HflC (stomatin/prohibitin superfamily)
MFDKLFEIIQAIFTSLLPFVVLQPFEEGCLCRLGVFKRVLKSGFHWCIPLGVDVVWHEHTTPTTAHLHGLSTTTKDGKSVGFDAIVTYQINDIQKALLGVTTVRDAITDVCMGIIGTELTGSTWVEVAHGDTLEGLTKACRGKGWKWGIEVIQVQLAGICQVKNIRLSGSGATSLAHGSGPSTSG